jgi:putative toxin-antitoxin system antitoxin component (TIGR02293 family)
MTVLSQQPPASTIDVRVAVHDSADVTNLPAQVRQGFAFQMIRDFEQYSGIDQRAIARVAGIPEATLLRRRKAGRFDVHESDRLMRIISVFNSAVQLFEGRPDAAARWLQTPAASLGPGVPWELLDTSVGVAMVERLIQQLKHGVYP